MSCLLGLVVGGGGVQGHTLDVLWLLLRVLGPGPQGVLWPHFHGLHGVQPLLLALSCTPSGEPPPIHPLCWCSWGAVQRTSRCAASSS